MLIPAKAGMTPSPYCEAEWEPVLPPHPSGSSISRRLPQRSTGEFDRRACPRSHGGGTAQQQSLRTLRPLPGTQHDPNRPQGRHTRRRAHPLQPLQHGLFAQVQPGHAHRRAARPGGSLSAAWRAPRRSRRRRGAEAFARLQPDARVRAVERPRPGNPGLRRAASLRHRPGNRHPGRQQDRLGADRGRHRRRRRHRLRCADRAQRAPAQDPARRQSRQDHPPFPPTASRARECRWASIAK